MGIFSVFRKTNVLYFPGCVTYFRFSENFRLYKKIFSKLGLNFKLIHKQVCCGLPALEAGYESEARKLARKNFDSFKKEDIEEIITNSPCCYKMFEQDYPEFLPDWDIKVKNLWEIILDKLESRPRLIKNKALEFVTYHDPCYLGRYSKVYEPVRRILESIGYEIKEMPDSKEDGVCCGSCGGLERINPKLADRIAKERILQAKRIGVKKIIVSSIRNYELLKRNIENNEIEVIELSEALAFALGIKKKQIKEEPEEEKISGEEQILLNTESNAQLEEELKEDDEGDWDK